VVKYYWFPLQNILWQNRTPCAPLGTCWRAFNTLKRVLNDKISNVVFNIFLFGDSSKLVWSMWKKNVFFERILIHIFFSMTLSIWTLLMSYSNLCSRSSRIWPKLSHEINIVITILDCYWIYDIKLYKCCA
jgi:hypothetical protein